MGIEIAQLEQELEERHKKELKEQSNRESSTTEGGVASDHDDIEQGVVSLSLASGTTATEEGKEENASQQVTGAGKKSRAQKRKVG